MERWVVVRSNKVRSRGADEVELTFAADERVRVPFRGILDTREASRGHVKALERAPWTIMARKEIIVSGLVVLFAIVFLRKDRPKARSTYSAGNRDAK